MKRLSTVLLLSVLALSARADILPGLEAYGDLTLVDEVKCATDTTHEMHDYPAGSSYATNILGSACRAMAHPTACAGYLSWKLGRDKGLEPHAMYLLVAEYPEDVARTVTLFNKGMDSRNGFYTGYAAGQSLSGGVLSQVHVESVGVPLSGGWSRVEQTMVLNENVRPYNGGSWTSSAANGFDVVFQLFKASNAPDSAGVALRSVKLYRVNDEAGYDAVLRYPAGDAPRRLVTWREEMSANSGYESNADRSDNARHKVRLMKALGVNCYSRTMLEFGYNKNWAGGWKDTTAPWWNDDWGGGGYWSSSAPSDDYTGELEAFAAGGIYLLPYYEYSGSRGSWGPYDGVALGVNKRLRSVPLFEDTGSYGTETNRVNHYVKASNGASNANVDITQEPAYDDMTRILGCTILRYASQANFVGAWIRNRGSMPVSFSDAALADFCRDTGRPVGSVTRTDILATISGSGPGDKYKNLFKYGNQYWSDLYTEYRTWWNGKRADWLGAMQGLLASNGVANAKVFFTGPAGEVGLTLHAPNGRSDDHTSGGAGAAAVLDSDWNFKSHNGAAYAAQLYKQYGLDLDAWTFYPYEYSHAEPKADPQTYQSVAGVAMTYPYDTVYSTVAGGADFGAPSFRNGSGDLFMSRFYCLHEGMNENESGAENNGYFTTEMDHAGRAIMLPELWGVLYQDPTVIGFLQGNHFARNFSLPFREFMENFLSLPAQAGTLVDGGARWSSSFGVRKYVAGGETYIAVVNAGKNALAGRTVDTKDSSLSTLWETVSGKPVAVSGGKFTADFEPYQLKCYSTVPPDAPKFLVAVPEAASGSASVPLDVSTLGGATATRTVRIAESADFAGAVALPDATLSAAGTNRIELTGLAPNTRYWVSVGITNGVGKGAARHFSFKTDVDPAYARGTMSAEAGVNAATLAVSLSTPGQGASSCDLYAVFVPADPGLETLSKKIGTCTAAGDFSFEVGPLSSEATYAVTLYATNSLGLGIRVDEGVVTTLPRPAGDPAAPEYRPGLMQHKYDCTKSEHPDWSVGAYGQADADRVLGTIMADVTGNPGPEVTNSLSGNIYKWADKTTFVYEGQMRFEGGVAYNFFYNVDDGVAIELDGTMFSDLGNSSGYQTITKVSTNYVESGWHDIRVWVYDWSGGKGYGSKVGNLGYTTGFAWNTNGTTTVTDDDVAKWSNFSDPGDGSLLRTRIGYGYVAVAGAPARSGNSLLVPLRYRSYDEDDELVVYRASAMPADPFDPLSWQGSAEVFELAFPGESTVSVTVPCRSLQPGDTVWLIARLDNARLDHESWSDPFSYTVPADLSAPEFTAALDGAAGFRDAAFSVAVGSLGDGAQNVTVTLAVTGGGATHDYTLAQNAASYTGTFRTPCELAYDTDYTAVVTVRNDLGRTATKTISFHTLPPEPVAGSVEATGVSYTNATVTANVSALGTDATRVDVVFQLATDAAFSHVVQTRSGLFVEEAPGSVGFVAGGLSTDTDYWARALLASDNGTSATTEAVAFRTLRYTAPAFAGGTAVVAGSSNAAMLSLALSSLGDGSGTVDVAWTLAGGPADATNGTAVVSAADVSSAVSFSGLAPETSYTLTLVATGANGLSAQLPPIVFRTPAPAVALGAPRVDLDADGTNVSASVEVLRTDAGAALYAVLDGGEPASVAADVLAETTYGYAFAVATGAVRTVVFRLVGGAGDVVQTPAVSVRGHKRADWFDVAFGEGYDGWPFPGSTGPDGGSWTLEGAPGVFDGAAARVLLAGGSDDRVVYQPAPPDPSKTDGAFRVSGRTRMLASNAALPQPAGTPLAALSMRDADGDSVVFAGWTAAGWTNLFGAVAQSGTDVDWTVDVDFEAGTVVYRVGGLVLADAAGATAFAAPAKASRTVDSVAWTGPGEVGDFQGWYFTSGGTLVVVAPVLFGLDDGDDTTGQGRPLPLSFVVDGENVPVMRLAISLAHVEPGVHLAAFECGNVAGEPKDWVCVDGSVEITAAQKAEGYLPVELDGSDTSKFVKLVASDRRIAPLTTLADLAAGD